MFKKILILVIVLLIAAPLSASAFWIFGKKSQSAATPSVTLETGLSTAEKLAAEKKYQIWVASFDKENIDTVIINQNNFWFSVAELNYIFETATKKAKNPILTNFNLNDNKGTLAINADFRKFIKGHISFIAQVASGNNKARLNISKLRLYGWPIPSAWLSQPLNKELDSYFSFLYADSRYQGFNFSDTGGVLKFQPKFK